MRMILTALALLLWCVSAEAQVANPGNLGSVCPGAGALCQPIPVQVVAFQGQGDIYTGTWTIWAGVQAFNAASIGSNAVQINCNATSGTPYSIVTLSTGQLDLPTVNTDCGTAIITAGSVTGTALTATTVTGGSLVTTGGQTIYGLGIPVGTTITSCTGTGSGSTCVISNSATGATPPFYVLTNLVFISRAYDQTGGGSTHDFVQATAGSQPILDLADQYTGLPCVYNGTTSRYLRTGAAIGTGSTTFTYAGAGIVYANAGGNPHYFLKEIGNYSSFGTYTSNEPYTYQGAYEKYASGSLNQWYALVGSNLPSGSAASEIYANSLTPPSAGSSGGNGFAGGDAFDFGASGQGCVAFAGAINLTAVNSTQANALIANMHTNLNNYSGF